ncbi:MAG: aldolase/citrate lyase family protein [Dehalococcoidia bacterium]
MLALRSTLVIDALDEAGLAAAPRSAADAIAIDLASPAVHGARERARALAGRRMRAIAEAGRPVHVRVSDTRSGELDADLDAVVGEHLAVIVLSGAEVPQDVRDADVAIRKREMRLSMEPGGIRLIPEIDSAEALTHLARILNAVDRHTAVALSVDGLRDDMRLGDRATALYDHAMADIAVAAHTARLPWVLAMTHHRPETAPLPTRAHDFGAAGVTVHQEAAARGMNALFAPDPTEVLVAREMVAEWDRLRARGAWVGVVAGEMLETRTYDRLVDRRSVRRARALIALADAIATREAAR